MTTLKQVLAAAESPELVGRVEELLLATGQAAIEQTRDGATALALARRQRFDLVLTEYPLSELRMDHFLSHLRAPWSTSQDASVVVVTGSLDREELAALGGELLAGVEICTSSREVLRAVEKSLRLSDRVSARLRVMFDGTTEAFSGRQSVWSRNVSPSGVLLGADHLLPVGMLTPIAIELSSDEPLVHGHAEVVRHTDPEREGVVGMAMRFIDLFDDGGQRLAAFVQDGMWMTSTATSGAG